MLFDLVTLLGKKENSDVPHEQSFSKASAIKYAHKISSISDEFFESYR